MDINRVCKRFRNVEVLDINSISRACGLRPPSCATTIHVGPRHFPWSFSVSVYPSKRISTPRQLSSCTGNPWESPASSWHPPHNLWIQPSSSPNCANVWLASVHAQLHVTPAQEPSSTRTSIPALMSSSAKTLTARPWSPLIAAPTLSYPAQRRHSSSSCEVTTSQCQPTGSNRPTFSPKPAQRLTAPPRPRRHLPTVVPQPRRATVL
jgi:hypothetical protein